MNVVVVVAFALVGLAATAVALIRDPERQAVTYSAFGLALTVLFFVLQAPDVALSQLVIGAAVLPLMVLLTIRAVHRRSLETAEHDRDWSSEADEPKR